MSDKQAERFWVIQVSRDNSKDRSIIMHSVHERAACETACVMSENTEDWIVVQDRNGRASSAYLNGRCIW